MSDDIELHVLETMAPAIHAYYVSNNIQQASTLEKKSSMVKKIYCLLHEKEKPTI